MSSAVVPRPRSAAEIFDASVRLARTHYGPLVTLSALCYLPIAVGQMLFLPSASPFINSPKPTTALLAPQLGWLLFSVIWYHATLTSAVTLGVSDAYLGEEVRPGRALAEMLQRFPAMFQLALIGMGLLALGMMAFAIPIGVLDGVMFALWRRGLNPLVIPMLDMLLAIGALAYVAAALMASIPTVVLERKAPLESLRRSAHLTHGLRGHVLAVYVPVYMVYLGLYYSLILLLRAGHVSSAIQHAAALVLVAILYPFVEAPFVVLYYDLRIRKEGYDVELMASALAASPAPQVA